MDESYELVLLRVLLRQVELLAHDARGDDEKWRSLLASDAYTEAARWLRTVFGQ
jgi:hypothetical protein